MGCVVSVCSEIQEFRDGLRAGLTFILALFPVEESIIDWILLCAP